MPKPTQNANTSRRPFPNREPLAPTAFVTLPLGAVRPRGWLENQLKIQRDGLTGRFPEVWPDYVGKNSGWLGGAGEAWEVGPYYCDGALPLAYLLQGTGSTGRLSDDTALLDHVYAFVDWTLRSQQPNGFFGPETERGTAGYVPKPKGWITDWWPRMLMLKVLTQYQEASGDERVIPFMLRYFAFQMKGLDERPLSDGLWEIAKTRCAENLLSVYWLYNRTGEKFLLDLAQKIFEQGLDWTEPLGEQFAYRGLINYPPDSSLSPATLKPFRHTHGVNVAMGTKHPGVWWQQSHDDNHRAASLEGIRRLFKYNGVVQGMFTGDEHIAGNSPTRGTELCMVVEFMFSLEQLLRIFGEPELGDRLERAAFNALPATIMPDWLGHQYLQQANQVLCTVARRNWVNCIDASSIFTYSPHQFRCCSANMHQGWPKYVARMWMATPDGGLAAVTYGPCQVTAEVAGGVTVTIIEDTEYPFSDTLRFAVQVPKPVRFGLTLRIPGWCEDASVQVGEEHNAGLQPSSFHTIEREWHNGETVILRLPMRVRLSRWHNDSLGVERGPLVYGLKIGERIRVIREDPLPEREVFPTTPWNYGLVADEEAPDQCFEVVRTGMSYQPFDPAAAPLQLKATGRRLPNWRLYHNSAAPPPQSPVYCTNSDEEITLIPFGCTNLRIAEFPEVKR